MIREKIAYLLRRLADKIESFRIFKPKPLTSEQQAAALEKMADTYKRLADEMTGLMFLYWKKAPNLQKKR